MKRTHILLAVFFVAILTTAAVMRSRALSLPQVPPGVQPEMWHPISGRLGIAIRGENFGARSELFGTFMVREGTEWRRVILSPGPGMVQAR
ncbi:MAG: hypothetical protein ACRD16_16490 [Thermoanaerobaculia bacterium]